MAEPISKAEFEKLPQSSQNGILYEYLLRLDKKCGARWVSCSLSARKQGRKQSSIAALFGLVGGFLAGLARGHVGG